MLADSTINQETKPVSDRFVSASYAENGDFRNRLCHGHSGGFGKGLSEPGEDRDASGYSGDRTGSPPRHGIEIPETLPAQWRKGLEALDSRELASSRRKKWKLCISGAALAVLAGLLILGIYSGLRKKSGGQSESADCP